MTDTPSVSDAAQEELRIERVLAEGLWAISRKRLELRPDYMPDSRTDFVAQAEQWLSQTRADERTRMGGDAELVDCRLADACQEIERLRQALDLIHDMEPVDGVPANAAKMMAGVARGTLQHQQKGEKSCTMTNARIADLKERLWILRQREVQMLGAALSIRNWHDTETAYNQLRDRLDRILPALRANEVALAQPAPVGMVEEAARCMVPPAGWECTRKPGHDGPCAAIPSARGTTLEFIQDWMGSGDHEPDRWHRDFAAAIDARLEAQTRANEVAARGEGEWWETHIETCPDCTGAGRHLDENQCGLCQGSGAVLPLTPQVIAALRQASPQAERAGVAEGLGEVVRTWLSAHDASALDPDNAELEGVEMDRIEDIRATLAQHKEPGT